jgi:hypothetical protein
LDKGQAKVFKFNLSGELLHTFCRPGQGPGEFNDPRQLVFAQDVLWVVDFGNGRIQLFKKDSYFKTITLTNPSRPRNLATIGDKVFVGPQSLIAEFGSIRVMSADGHSLNRVKAIDTPDLNRNQAHSLWRMFEIQRLGMNRLLLGFYYDNLLVVIDLKGNILASKQMDHLYQKYEDRRGPAVFPAGYAAMAFSEGPEETILVATCDQEKRLCGTIYQLDTSLNKPLKRWNLGESVRTMRYVADKDLLVVGLRSEVRVYGFDDSQNQN